MGRVLLKDLADTFVPDPAASFPPGKLVAAKVVAVDAATGRVTLSLRPSAVLGDKKKAAVAGLSPGTFHKGVVVRVESFGVFVELQGGGGKGGGFGGVKGLCHLSEAADMFVSDLGAVYAAGDLVRCKVLRVNKDKGTVSLGLKASYFEGAPETDSEEDDDDEDKDEESGDESEEDEGAAMAGSDDEEDSDDEEGSGEEEAGGRVLEAMSASESEAESDDENFGAKLQKQLKGGENDEEDDGEDDDEQGSGDDESDEESGEEGSAAAVLEGPARSAGAVAASGFEWGDFSAPAAEYSTATGFDDDASEGEGGGGGGDDDDSDEGSSKKRKRSQSSKQKQKAREAEEQAVRKAERAVAAKARAGDGPGGGGDDEAMAAWAADDFERELLASPNESNLWVRYMATKLKVLELNLDISQLTLKLLPPLAPPQIII
jgi:predicted RNA-binding protein with RPS1 domain